MECHHKNANARPAGPTRKAKIVSVYLVLAEKSRRLPKGPNAFMKTAPSSQTKSLLLLRREEQNGLEKTNLKLPSVSGPTSL